MPHLTHPLNEAFQVAREANEKARKNPQRPVSLPQDYPATDRDRLNKVIEENRDLKQRVAVLEGRGEGRGKGGGREGR